MLKILQARFQQDMNQELPDVQAGFRKDRGTMDQIANTHWIIEKAWEFQEKTYTSVLLFQCVGAKSLSCIWLFVVPWTSQTG